jgi:hypothetical protein
MPINTLLNGNPDTLRKSTSEIAKLMQGERVNRKTGQTEHLKVLRYPHSLEDALDNESHWLLFTIYDSMGGELKYKKIEDAAIGVWDSTVDAVKGTADGIHDLINGKSSSSDVLGGLQTAANNTLEMMGIPTAKIPKREGSVASGMVSRNQIRIESPEELAKAQIALFIPDKVNVSYGANYNEVDLSFISSFQQIKDRIGPNNGSDDALWRSIGESAFRNMIDDWTTGRSRRKSLSNLLPSLSSVISPSGARPNLKRALEAYSRKVPYPHMEYLFRSINRRTFEYSFLFMPRSQEEADTVDNIIKTFKYHAHPRLANDERFQYFPSEFEINFFVGGTENLYLHRSSRLALEGISVDYSANPSGVFTTFRSNENGAPPVATLMTLRFAELEILHRDRIAQGF